MRFVGFCCLNFSIIDFSRETRPDRFFEYRPLFQYRSISTDLEHHVQACAHHNEAAVRNGCDMMHIVELWQGDVADLFEGGQLENDYFGGCAAVKDVANQGGTF